jgi:hypothetical protein
MRHFMYAFSALALLSTAAHADDKKKPKDDGSFDDLFGKPADGNKGGPSGVDAMKKATESMGDKKKAGDTLAPKVGAIDTEAKIVFLNVFAAQNIVDDKKLGCVPMGKDKRKVTEWSFDELPAKANTAFDVCLTLQCNAGREVTMRTTVVDPRGARVVNYETSVNFSNRPKLDVITEYPAPLFKTPGQYFYVIDIDGKEAGRLPLFVVKVEGETSGAVGSTPSDLPARNDAPVPSGAPAKDASDNPLKAATSQDP